jgi:4-hydroxybenzoate polyprenyltransferase
MRLQGGGKRGVVIPVLPAVRDFLAFIRVETCLFISGMAATGYLIFSPLSPSVMYPFFTVFFLSAAAYSYNHLTDRREDLINNKRLNRFVTNGKGPWLVAVLIFLSIYFSLRLPESTFLVYLVWVGASLAYSAFGVKKTLLVKNLYTAFVMGIAFLIGAMAQAAFTKSMLIYYLAVSSFGFNINLLGDLRGYRGDKLTGINTIPVRFGYEVGKKVFYVIFSVFLVSVFILNLKFLYPLALFVILAFFFLKSDELIKVRYSILLSFIVLPAVIILKKTAGGI